MPDGAPIPPPPPPPPQFVPSSNAGVSSLQPNGFSNTFPGHFQQPSYPHQQPYVRQADVRSGLMQTVHMEECKDYVLAVLPDSAFSKPLENKDEIVSKFAEFLHTLGPIFKMLSKGFNGANGKFYGKLKNFVMAFDFDEMSSKFTGFVKFMQSTLFPKPFYK
jgi:hypothetical protein